MNLFYYFDVDIDSNIKETTKKILTFVNSDKEEIKIYKREILKFQDNSVTPPPIKN